MGELDNDGEPCPLYKLRVSTWGSTSEFEIAGVFDGRPWCYLGAGREEHNPEECGHPQAVEAWLRAAGVLWNE